MQNCLLDYVLLLDVLLDLSSILDRKFSRELDNRIWTRTLSKGFGAHRAKEIPKNVRTYIFLNATVFSGIITLSLSKRDFANSFTLPPVSSHTVDSGR